MRRKIILLLLFLALAAISLSVYYLIQKQQESSKREFKTTYPQVIQEEFWKIPDKERARVVTGLLDGKNRELFQTIRAYKNVQGAEKKRLEEDLKKQAAERKPLFIETMRRNPDAALRSLLPEEERLLLHRLAPNYVEEMVTEEGSLVIEHADFFTEGVSKTQYTLVMDDQ